MNYCVKICNELVLFVKPKNTASEIVDNGYGNSKNRIAFVPTNMFNSSKQTINDITLDQGQECNKQYTRNYSHTSELSRKFQTNSTTRECIEKETFKNRTFKSSSYKGI